MSPTESPPATQPAFSIVRETDDYVIVNKSPGVGFHDEVGAPGICSLVQTAIDHPLFPVHRLDKNTSGLLLLPKKSEVARELTEQFSHHHIEKFYIALSATKPTKKQGWVIGDMTKARNGAWKLLRTRENPACTYFLSKSLMPGIRGFLLRLYSGKTHQARVALKSVSAPILGDVRYGGNTDTDRMYLHAYGLKFRLWGEEQQVILRPDAGALFCSRSMDELLDEWGNPWEISWPIFRPGDSRAQV